MAKPRVLPALIAIAVVVCALLVTPASFADSYVRIVRLSDIDGSVQIDRNTGHGFEKAIQNMPITQGVRLKTDSDGKAEVEFENGSVVRIASGASVTFSQLSLQSDGKRLSEIRVTDGVAYIDFKHKGDDNFHVLAGNHTIDLRKDVHFRIKVDSSQAEVAVMKGELGVQDLPQLAKVKKNETFSLELSDNSHVMLAQGLTRDPSDNWDQQRTEYLQQYASRNTYGSPYAYGYSDMYRYGMFRTVPGYGTIWRPYGVGLDWDPYSSGYWSNYPVFGWIWSSDYQWGWTPYRFGSWAYVPNLGWSWQPGNWGRWNRVPTYINPPTNWTHPTPPPPGAGTTVIVGVPRGPRTRGFDDGTQVGPGVGTNPNPNDGGRVRTLPGRGTPTAVTTPPGTTTTTTTTPGAQPSQPVTQRSTEVPRPSRGPRDADSGQRQPRSVPSPQPREQPSHPSQPAPRIETPRPSPPPPRMETPRSMPQMHEPRAVPHESPHPNGKNN